MKILFLIFLFGPFIAKAKTERLSVLPSLVSNLCQMQKMYELEHAPRTRSSTRVLPNRPPASLTESPFDILRNPTKSTIEKEEFVKKFWESYERHGGSRKEAQKQLAQKEKQVNEVSSTCDLSADEQKQLFTELKP